MSNHMSGNRGSDTPDDVFAELEHGIRTSFEAGDQARQSVGYEFDLEQELMRELGASPVIERQSLHEEIPALSPDVEDLPNMHLGAGRASRLADQHYGLDASFDAAAESLESEFNALIGNTPAFTAEAPVMPPVELPVERVELVESPMSKHSPDLAAAEPKAANENPFEMLAAMAERYSQSSSHDDGYNEPAQAQRVEPSFEPAQRSQGAARAQVSAPSIDTIEINDHAYYAQDDLDLPATYEEEPVAMNRNLNDEIDSDFFELLNQMSGQGAQPKAAPAAPQYYDEDRYEQPVYAQPAPRAAASSASYATRGSEQIAITPVAGYDDRTGQQTRTTEDFDLADVYDDDVDFSGYDPNEQAARPKRKFWAAAVVGGLAVVAAAGAFAMNMVGGGVSGAPVLVQADNSPIKVRPANPGGATIPNQNSGVYDAVSGANPTATAQKKLVNGAEAPIETALNLPENADDEIIDEAAAEAGDAKSEDRIEQTAQADTPATGQRAVAPKKVRTVTVKPDGSIEHPVAAKKPAKAQPKQEVAAADADESVDDVLAGNAKPAKVAKAAPASVAEDQTTASIPAASGGWAMQIASEGTEQAAKAAYKKLSAKYPAISGKGVAIVKAEVSGAIRYRVRVISESKADAQDLCSGIKSKGGSCFVSKS